MDPSSSSSNTTNYNIESNINNTQDNPLSSFFIPTYNTTPPTTSYIPNFNPNNTTAANPTTITDPSPSSSSQPPRGSSKKRTRASRRAPTTVLSTDTSNFRAMVQEFTGFPSPPFNSSSASINTSFNHLLSRSSFPPHTASTTTFSPSSILHAIAANSSRPLSTAPSTLTTYPTLPMFNNATPSSINNLMNVGMHGRGHNDASSQYGDLGRFIGVGNNGDQDGCDDGDNSSNREEKRRKSLLDSWNGI